MLAAWATRHHVSQAALAELKALMGMAPIAPTHPTTPGSEASAQQRIRLEAPNHGVCLYRNNTGAAMDKTGRLIRYGLANDSPAMSRALKSSDLIGITPHKVTVADIGYTLGIFTSIEVKRPGWTYKGTEREAAQLKWIEHVVSHGGRGMFATGPEDIWIST